MRSGGAEGGRIWHELEQGPTRRQVFWLLPCRPWPLNSSVSSVVNSVSPLHQQRIAVGTELAGAPEERDAVAAEILRWARPGASERQGLLAHTGSGADGPSAWCHGAVPATSNGWPWDLFCVGGGQVGAISLANSQQLLEAAKLPLRSPEWRQG